MLSWVLSFIENLVVFIFLCILFDLPWNKIIKKILLFSFFYSILTTVTFFVISDVFLRVTVNILLHILLLSLIFSFNIRFILIFTTNRSIIQIITEIIMYTIFYKFCHVTNPVITKLIIALPSWIFIILLTVLIKQKKLMHCFISSLDYYKYKYLSYIFIFALLQIIVVVLINFRYFEITKEVDTFKFLGMITIILMSFVVYFVIKFANEIEEKSLKKSEEFYLENIEELINSVKIQRHDYLNHIQVLKNLIDNKDFDEVTMYIKELHIELNNNQVLLGLNHPALAALLKAKIEVAKAKGIQLEVNVESTLPSLKIKSYELVQIVGNIIDNAIEAELESNITNKKIQVKIDRLLNSYLVISVYNKNSFIPQEKVNVLFLKGVTTKEKHLGIGLYIVSRLLKKYNSTINVQSKEGEGTTFIVFIPY
jgi:two-component system, LytTR family, sensor histidine kinase AgrC